MPFKFKLRGGTKLMLGNTQVDLPADTDVWFPSVGEGDYDALAGALGSNQATFGMHLADLVHDETISGRDEEGEYTQKVRVSYGAHAARQAQPFGEKTRVVPEMPPLPPLAPLPVAAPVDAGEVAASDAPTQPFPTAAPAVAAQEGSAIDPENKTGDDEQPLPNPAEESMRRLEETDADKIQSLRTLIGVKQSQMFNNPTDEALKAKLTGEIEALRVEVEALERAQQST